MKKRERERVLDTRIILNVFLTLTGPPMSGTVVSRLSYFPRTSPISSSLAVSSSCVSAVARNHYKSPIRSVSLRFHTASWGERNELSFDR